MANFNTNQARHLYVALDVKTLSNQTTDPATVLTTAGDIALTTTVDNDFAFVYHNADGKIVRSDIIKPAKVLYANYVPAADLAIPLNKVTITTSNRSALAGKQVQITIMLKEQIGLDFSENYPIVVNLACTATNTGSDALLYAALKAAIEDAIANFPHAPFAVSGGTSNVVLTECAQPWVADKFEADPIHFEVYASELESTGEPWATITPASAGTTIGGDYKIADLERFAFRERSEVYGMTVWPFNYEHKYLIYPSGSANTYSMLTIQYYYSGSAEDVQKSPRTIHIAAASSDALELAEAIAALGVTVEGASGSQSGSSSSSQSGSGAAMA